MIDLRSDTVTKPSPPMLEAMFAAEVGDDVFNEDPTVIELENKLAKLFGHEAALFCPSGTMCNQIAIKVHTRPYDEIILDKLSHVYFYETGGYAANAGCSIKLIDGNQGKITAKQVEAAIQADYDWLPVSKLVVVENTSNKGGGAFYDLTDLKEIAALCKQKDLKLHLDGARFFNALVASETRLEDYHGLFDSISICLSKGLGAPIGSVLIGNKAFIKRARKIRKALGGGMRQVGFLAAAGLYALDNNINRLKIDHEHAAILANCLESLAFVTKVIKPATNIVLFDVSENIGISQVLAYLHNNGVEAVAFGEHTIRFVTHLDVDRNAIQEVCDVLQSFTLS